MKTPVEHIPGGFEVFTLVYFIPFILIAALVVWLRASKNSSLRNKKDDSRFQELLKVIHDDPSLNNDPRMEDVLKVVGADIARKS